MGCIGDKAPGRRELRARQGWLRLVLLDLGTRKVREGAVWVSGRSVLSRGKGWGKGLGGPVPGGSL